MIEQGTCIIATLYKVHCILFLEYERDSFYSFFFFNFPDAALRHTYEYHKLNIEFHTICICCELRHEAQKEKNGNGLHYVFFSLISFVVFFFRSNVASLKNRRCRS